MVAPDAYISSAMDCGVYAMSGKYTDAPAHIGKISMPPSPKVKASGGEPITMSSVRARSTWRGQVSQAASTSRWVCTAAFGLPVVPEVKAKRATSVAAVAHAAKRLGLRAAMASSDCAAAGWLNTITVRKAGD